MSGSADPYAGFEAVAPADPYAGFEAVDAPPVEQRSRLGLNIEEGFRGTLAGEAIERTRSGQVAGFAADAADRAVQEAEAAGSNVGLEQAGGQPSPYGGIPLERLRALGAQARTSQETRATDYQTNVLPQRAAEAATVTPWNQGNIIDQAVQGGTALAGQVIGSLGSPESYVGPAGARMLRAPAEGAARYVGRQVVESGIPNAVAGAAADIPVQVGEMGRGQREAYDPADTALAALLGGVIGTGIPASAEAVRAVRARLAARRGTPDVDMSTVTLGEVSSAWNDPEVQAVARANGITSPDDPRMAQLAPRLEARREAEAARNAPAPVQAADGSGPLQPPMPPEQVPPAATGARPVAPDGAVFTPGAQPEIDMARDHRAGYGPSQGAVVPLEPQPNRMTPGEIARAQAEMRGGNQNAAEPPPRFVAPEDGLPRVPDQVQQGRQAEDAFRQAEAQRARAGGDVRDTQPAPRPDGVAPQTVHLDQGFPVRILGRDDRGFVSVERYDPRTGAPDPEAVPYAIRESQLEQRQYAANPRQAQDFTARSGSPRNPEVPRDAGPGRPQQEPRQTYRATQADPNADFPGATRPGPEEGAPPPGRAPFPEQPPGSAGRRWSSAEEAERGFQQRRAQAEEDAQRARESGEWNSGQRSTNQPGAQGADGRWPVGAGGYVASSTGGPIRFGDQKMAARWIIGQGQAKSPDQFFEIAVHPSGQGFTVREAGRNAGSPPPGARPAEPRPAAEGQRALPPPARASAEAPPIPPQLIRAARLLQSPGNEPMVRNALRGLRDRMVANGEDFDAAAQRAGVDPRVLDEPAAPSRFTPEEEAARARRDEEDAYIARVSRESAELEARRQEVSRAERERMAAEEKAKTDAEHERNRRVYEIGEQRKAEEATRFREARERVDAYYRNETPAAPETTGRTGQPPAGGEGSAAAPPAPGRAASSTPAERLEAVAAERRAARAPTNAAEAVARDAQEVKPKDMLGGERQRAAVISPDGRVHEFPASYGAEGEWAGKGAHARFAKEAGSDAYVRVTAYGDEVGADALQPPTPAQERALRAMGAAVRRTGGEGVFADGAGGGRLYSNPLDPAAFKHLLLDPAMRQAVRLRNALRGSTAARAFSTFFDSNRGALFTFRDHYPNVPEIGVLTDHLATDPGTGRTVKGTFQTEVTSRAQGAMNRVQNILGAKATPDFSRAVRDALTGQRATTPEVAKAAANIRHVLNTHLAYLRKAGIEVGETRNFFPRQYDEAAINADPNGFRTAVEGEYRKAGLSAAEAESAARAFTDEVLGQAVVGFRNEALLSANSVKGRKLPASADAALAKYLVTDPREALSRYFSRTTRLAEFTKRFGQNGEMAAEWFARMARQGVDPDHIQQMRRHFQSATGTLDNGDGVSAGSAAAGWIQTAGIVARLTGAVISSLPEALAVGTRTGNPLRGAEALVDMFTTARRSQGQREARQLAEWLGVVGTSGPDLTLAAQAGVAGQTKLQQRIVDGLFKMNGLHQLTDQQRVVATRHGALFVRQMADEIADGASTKASAVRLMAELGMDEKAARDLSAWLKKKPGEAEVLADTPQAQSYRAAITRFVNETIQNPEPIDKPLWAAHPVGRLAYGITSFQYAFTRNVLMRSLKQFGEAVGGEGLSLQDRARLAGPLAGMAILMAAQSGISELRDRLGNSQQRKERDPVLTTLSNVDRTGMFGNLSPLVNVALSARYQTDPASRLAGPYVSNVTNQLKALVGTIPQPYGPNSPRTNNAENSAARAFYSGALAPAVIAGLAVAPLPAPLKALAGAAAVAATRPDAQRAFADAVTGPPTVRGRAPGSQRDRRR